MTNCQVVCCCDSVRERAEQLALETGAGLVLTDWQDVASRDDIDVLLVATTHEWLAPITAAAADGGKHVFVEKPGARKPSELDPVLEAARRRGVKVRVGFNHRYHRAFRKARELFNSGVLGEPMFIRGRYGHGGRPGYSQEWRARPESSGGGELIDQGSHLVDLARWYLGDFTRVRGKLATYFWNMPVEDNAFLLLETAGGQTAFLHASWTEWKNLFSFEIAGRTGKLEISGLGGSYGVERLTLHRMLPEMGPPETTCWEYPMADDSWKVEFGEFIADIFLDRQPVPGIEDARAVLRILEAVYKAERTL
jgi:predicted dehydrogenase